MFNGCLLTAEASGHLMHHSTHLMSKRRNRAQKERTDLNMVSPPPPFGLAPPITVSFCGLKRQLREWVVIVTS